jgi:hypothetical protein
MFLERPKSPNKPCYPRKAKPKNQNDESGTFKPCSQDTVNYKGLSSGEHLMEGGAE